MTEIEFTRLIILLMIAAITAIIIMDDGDRL